MCIASSSATFDYSFRKFCCLNDGKPSSCFEHFFSWNSTRVTFIRTFFTWDFHFKDANDEFATCKNLGTLNQESSKKSNGALGRKYAKSQEESESSYTLKKSGDVLA